MKKLGLLFIITLGMLVGACSGGAKKENGKAQHKVLVLEVVQAQAYTYLNVVEDSKEQWIAVPKMKAQLGDTYYFESYMEMKDFRSKDLNRSFESVYFIEALTSDPGNEKTSSPNATSGNAQHQLPAQDQTLQIDTPEGGIKLEELFGNTNKYAQKKVVIRGKIVKANLNIMQKNWYHLQDGTAANNMHDLTVTTLETGLNVGDVVSFEGTIVLNKDFGHGYSYKVLMEEAVLLR